MPHARLILFLIMLGGCARAPQELVLSGRAMGTTYSIKVAAPPSSVDQQVLNEAVQEVLAHIDRTMSGYRSDSEISRFNASSSTEWFDVSADVATVVLAGLQVSEQSGGAFDVTVAPLVEAWGFGAAGEPATLPDANTLRRLRESVGYRRLHARAQPPALRKDLPTLTVDLNGIAPGYAVDLITRRFAALQVANFMIELGGEVRARGRNAQSESWRIAVERPVDSEPTPYAIVQLDDRAVTTSGGYRHYYLRDGRSYSHTIDPRTGRPVEHDLASVVVMGATAMEADAWGTALNVLGSQAGYALAVQQGLAAMFIDVRSGQMHRRATPEFEAQVIWSEGGS
jgi:FAD:protein FMN transferase